MEVRSTKHASKEEVLKEVNLLFTQGELASFTRQWDRVSAKYHQAIQLLDQLPEHEQTATESLLKVRAYMWVWSAHRHQEDLKMAVPEGHTNDGCEFCDRCWKLVNQETAKYEAMPDTIALTLTAVTDKPPMSRAQLSDTTKIVVQPPPPKPPEPKPSFFKRLLHRKRAADTATPLQLGNR